MHHGFPTNRHTTDNVPEPSPYAEVRGAELMAAPVMGGGAPAGDSAPTELQRNEAEDEGENFIRLSHGVFKHFSTPPRPFFSRVLPTSKLLLRVAFSAVARWAPSLRGVV
jgi:hypothetical protein